jgi:LmbE family N-acetylglucosaminyl deacetylase
VNPDPPEDELALVRRPEVARPRAVLGRVLRERARSARSGSTTVAAVAVLGVLALLAAVGVVSAASAEATGCPVGSVVVVAHPDDDLFFINPAIQRDIDAGLCSTTVFATSGDSGDTGSYYRNRENGIRAAYATMGGVANDWTSARVAYAGRTVTQLTLTARPSVQLVFLRLPDGNIDGSGFASTGFATLRKLSDGAVATVPTVDTPRQTYGQQQIVDTLGSLMAAGGTTAVRTMDTVANYGEGDHSDHVAIARIAASARDAYVPGASFTSYAGYLGGGRPVNVAGADLTGKIAAFEAYAPHDWNMCLTYATCVADERVEPLWLQRSIVVSSSPGTGDPGQGTSNVAGAASVTASSQNSSTGQLATKAVDGRVDGYPDDHTAEWATIEGAAGSWLQLIWPAPVRLDRVVLHDRPNGSDRIASGTLTFSDGSAVAIPTLEDDGSAVPVTFAARTTTSLRMTVTTVSGSTSNVGLAELEAWTAGSDTTPTTPPTSTPPTSTPPTTPPTSTPPPPTVSEQVAGTAAVTASSQNTSTGQLATKAVDGTVDGYPGDHTAEWATVGGGEGSWLQLTWSAPVRLDRVVLYDRPNSSDQVTGGIVTFSDGSTLPVPSLTGDASATPLTFAARMTTSLRLTVTSVSDSTQNVGLAELEAWTAVSSGTPTTTPPTTAPPTTTPPTTTPPTTTPPTTTPPTTTPPPSTTNLAPSASVTASSENTSTGQLAVRAVDGVVSGYPATSAAEWATVGGWVGSWLQLSWTSPVTVGRVVLFDRPNANDQVISATLTFSDGTTVTTGALENGAGVTTVTFPARRVTWVRFTVTSVSGTTENAGLAEVEVYGA